MVRAAVRACAWRLRVYLSRLSSRENPVSQKQRAPMRNREHAAGSCQYHVVSKITNRDHVPELKLLGQDGTEDGRRKPRRKTEHTSFINYHPTLHRVSEEEDMEGEADQGSDDEGDEEQLLQGLRESAPRVPRSELVEGRAFFCWDGAKKAGYFPMVCKDDIKKGQPQVASMCLMPAPG